MARNKKRLKIASYSPASGVRQGDSGWRDRSGQAPKPGSPLVSGRWLFSAVAVSIAAAAICAWAVLCLLFWQGSWQVLYHPAAVIARTPASAGLAFDGVEFADTDAGVPRLKGWWIPAAAGAPFSRFTFLYLHGSAGNLGDTVDALARLHAAGVNVLAFDYRGYGQSEFARPSEAHWRQDAGWALQYLIQTRHIDPGTILPDGTGLGANLALEVAAEHPELAGVVVESPIKSPMDPVLNDARARTVPVRSLVRDRYDLDAAAAATRIPLLWFARPALQGPGSSPEEPEAYRTCSAHKMLVWLDASENAPKEYVDTLSRWLDGLTAR